MSGFKKAIKTVAKVATKLDFGHQVVKSIGLPDPMGDALYGDNKTLSPAEKAAKSQQDAAENAARMEQTRFDSQATALKNRTLLEGANAAQNTVQVQTGGGDTPDSVLNDMRRRKRPGASVATGLGIY